MKEKYDLSLDNRQIVSLLIGGLVVLGAVFVLGVVVGKKLSTDERTADAPDLLAALDAQADRMKQVHEDPALTFQEELTKKVEPAPEPEPVAAKVEPAAPAKPEPVAAAPAKEDPAPEEEPAEPEPVPTRTQEGALKEAIARAQRPAEVAPNGAFTLQLSASQDRAEADRFATKLRDRGFAPFVVAAEVPGRGTWYRVRMGGFPSREAAARYLQDFRRETQLDAFVAANE